LMKDGAILGNSGHFNVEIDISSLRKMSKKVRRVRENVEEYTLSDGRRIYLLAEGRLLNLSAAEGHPSSVMDMSFSNQALSVLYLIKEEKGLKPALYPVPIQIDKEIAKRKLSSLNIKIDSLSPAQKKYLSSWQSGT